MIEDDLSVLGRQDRFWIVIVRGEGDSKGEAIRIVKYIVWGEDVIIDS